MIPLTDEDKIHFIDNFVTFEEVEVFDDTTIKAELKGTRIRGYGSNPTVAWKNLIQNIQEHEAVFKKVHELLFSKFGLP